MEKSEKCFPLSIKDVCIFYTRVLEDVIESCNAGNNLKFFDSLEVSIHIKCMNRTREWKEEAFFFHNGNNLIFHFINTTTHSARSELHK